MPCLAGSKSYPCVMAIQVPRPFRMPLTEAEFSYTVDQDVIKVVDLNLGSNSVTNDAERVLRKIERWQPGLIARCRIMTGIAGEFGMEWGGTVWRCAFSRSEKRTNGPPSASSGS